MKTVISSVWSIQKIYFGLVTPSEVPSIGFYFLLSHSEFPFFSFAHVHSKSELRKCSIFRLFHILSNTYSHLWKEFLVCSLEHSNLQLLNATTMEQIYERDGMCAVMNQCPERLGSLTGVIVVPSRYFSFSLRFAVSIEFFARERKRWRNLWNIAPKIAFFMVAAIADTFISMMADNFLEWIFHF